MPVCRWVVLAEQCYNDLLQQSQPTLQLAPTHPGPEHEVGAGNTEPTKEIGAEPEPKKHEIEFTTEPEPATETNHAIERSTESGSVPETQPDTQSIPTEPETAPASDPLPTVTAPAVEPAAFEEEEENGSPDPPWLADIPNGFKKDAANFIAKLVDKGGFEISDSGHLIIDGRRLNFLAGDFLRTTNVPYNKGQLPAEVESWLRSKNVTKFRNPILKIRPKWEKVYSWRKSTTAKRAGR